MMSAPDRVDVELPNTEEVKMTSVSSTGNLRNLVPPDQQQGHQHAGKFFFRIVHKLYIICVLQMHECTYSLGIKKVIYIVLV